MNIEDIVAAQQAVIDEAGDQPLNDDQAQRYEQLEKDLAVARRDVEIRSRQNAYTTPVSGAHINVAASKPDETLTRAFESYLRTGQGNQDLTEYRAQGSTTTAGGYLIPPGFRQKLVEVQKAYGGLANEVDNITTTEGNSLVFPSLDDTANSGTITTESSTFSNGADMVFGQVSLGAFKYTSSGASNLPLRVPVELAQDSAFDVGSLVARVLGTRIARKQASDWCIGTGTTLPFGIAHSGLTPDKTLTTPGTITYADLLAAEALLDPSYEQNAKWVMNKAAWTKVRGVVDGAQRPLVFDQAASGMGGRPEKQLLGYPVILDQAMQNVSGGAGLHCMVFGDLREAYVIRHVQNTVIVADPYSRAANGEIQYVAWERADGNIQNRKAYVLIKG